MSALLHLQGIEICFNVLSYVVGDGGGTAAFNGTNVHPMGVRSVNTEHWWKDN